MKERRCFCDEIKINALMGCFYIIARYDGLLLILGIAERAGVSFGRYVDEMLIVRRVRG